MPVLQEDYASGTRTATLTLTGVTAGSEIEIAFAQVGTGNNPYTASSNVDGALTAVTAYNPDGASGAYVGIFRLTAATAGNHTITVGASAGSLTVHAWAFEVSNLDAGASPVTPTNDGAQDAGVGDSHICAPPGEIDTSGAAFILCVGTVNGTVTSSGAGTGYTAAEAAATNRAFCQYKEATGAVANDQGGWVTVGVDRIGTSTMAAFPTFSGGGGSTGSDWVCLY